MRERKRVVQCIILIAVTIILFLFTLREEKVSANVLRAMYVPLGEDSYVMIDLKSNAIFTVPECEKILDEKGQEIALSDLQRGNVVDIYGSGIMAESYPGQYMGVSKICLVEEGNPLDADCYEDMLQGLYVASDSSERPALCLDYTTDMAMVSALPQEYAYDWKWQEDDEEKTDSKNDVDILQMAKEDILDVGTETALNMTLTFSKMPEDVVVYRWSLDKLGIDENVDAQSDKEEITVSGDAQSGWVLNQVEPGYVYSVTGTWQQGTVSYVFYVEAK